MTSEQLTTPEPEQLELSALPGWSEEYGIEHEAENRGNEAIQDLGAVAAAQEAGDGRDDEAAQEAKGPQCGDCGALLADGCPHVGTRRSGQRYTRGN